MKFIRRWSARNTYYHMCRDEVMMEVEEMSGSPPGSQAFLGCLQDATTKLWKRLTPGVQQVYVSLSRKWSDEFPPPNIQARYVYCLLYINTLMPLRQNGELSQCENHARLSSANI